VLKALSCPVSKPRSARPTFSNFGAGYGWKRKWWGFPSMAPAGRRQPFRF